MRVSPGATAVAGRPKEREPWRTSEGKVELAAFLIVCLVTVTTIHVAHAQWPQPDELLRSCLSSPDDQPQGATFKAFLQGKHPRLTLHHLFWSTKMPCPPPPPSALNKDNTQQTAECPLTLVTTLTATRLHGLQQLCRSWPGPLVAALYLPLSLGPGETLDDQHLAALKELLSNDTNAAEEVFARMERDSQACALRLMVLYEVLAEPVMRMLLPINSLRNMALLAATTPLVAMIDVDLVVSASLGQQLITGPWQDTRMRSAELIRLCQDKTAVILPALEPHTGRRSGLDQLLAWADKSVAVNKSELVSMVRADEMCFFQELSYPRGHRLTNFPRWFQSNWPYQVHWQMFFEPWFLVSRSLNPWYDVRFQGYGYNKQNHVAGLAISGFKFYVHPDAWVVHRPHDKTAVQRLYVVALNSRARLQKAGRDVELVTNFTDASSLTSAQVGALLQHHVKAMFLTNQQLAKTHSYVPHIDGPTRRCLALLPWWNSTRVPMPQ